VPWKMFMIEPTKFCRRSLRRFFKFSGVHSGHYHEASVVIDAKFESPGVHGRGLLRDGYENSPAWPKNCACGYQFVEEDHWQVNEQRLYKGAPERKLYPLHECPPGATWECDWFPKEGPNGNWTGPDGKVWAVMLPGGVEFIIHMYSSDVPRRKWNVTGTPPLINVSPSINQKGHYHGFIGLPHAPAPGIITEDCEGRKFPQWPSTA
jgi:hypothetical protein